MNSNQKQVCRQMIDNYVFQASVINKDVLLASEKFGIKRYIDALYFGELEVVDRDPEDKGSEVG